ncbi:nucleic acid-binding protein [Clostridium sp. SHJSY1]|uniref:nucleic acid-binding protein n=1 Tax=Clostridium sp. SHJSY1 TaxID=2942483 RepID=UPI0028763C6F|nr:nucleic acid-binding protein [Clostridium sp. SHJSY1]MDS0524840.1 nucleic acid-binding protein [Clostridium sp. SHJSY1]
MKTCYRCQCEMVDGFDIKVDMNGYGIKISKGIGVFTNRMEKTKVAICPKCREISLYVENLVKLTE